MAHLSRLRALNPVFHFIAAQHHVPLGAVDAPQEDDGEGPSHRHSRVLPIYGHDTVLRNPCADRPFPPSSSPLVNGPERTSNNLIT